MRTAALLVAGFTLVAAAAGAQPMPGPPTADVRDALVTALQDEHHAHAVYARVIEAHGDVRPFVNVVRAEQRHIDALLRTFGTLGIAAPEPAWTTANVPAFASVAEACAAAATAERENIALYDQLLAPELPPNVRQVFVRLRDASLERHLPAFERCGGAGAGRPARTGAAKGWRAGRR